MYVSVAMNFKQDQLNQYFPKAPYEVQRQISATILTALRANTHKVIVIESPTGTGKTYSLLCPILAWLTDNPRSLPADQTKQTARMPPWLKKVEEQKGQKLLREKQNTRDAMISLKQAAETLKNKKRANIGHKRTGISNQALDEEIEIESQQECRDQIVTKHQVDRHSLEVQNQLRLQSKAILPRLIFVSRTHSQLSQVIGSLQQILKDRKDLTYLQLASKQQLCINKEINEHKTAINEQCQHLLDHSSCPYFHKLPVRQFYNNSVQTLLRLGLDNNLCPYYSSRAIVQHVDILCLPYASVLNQDIRNKLGINVNNAILVFDEGHNIVDFEKGMKSKQVSVQELEKTAQQIDEYLKKYRDRLRVRNERLLAELLEILRSLSTAMQCLRKEHKQQKEKKYLKVNYIDLLLRLGLKQIRIQKIIRYFQLNNIDKKLAYFNSTPQISKPFTQPTPFISTATINKVLDFILQLVTFKQQNQALLLKWSEHLRLKIMCLESEQLQKLIEKSRMTIIAGGTMEPLDELMAICSKWKERTLVEKYPHVVKPHQCNIYMIKSCKAKEILFNHQTSNQQQAHLHFKPICVSILDKVISNTEPGSGIVIFIQNYQLLAMFENIFKGQPFEKWILYDSKNKNEKESQDLFSKHKKIVESNPSFNPILISVMGGKLSEGINFSDRLARALVVFGLPYSNVYAPEIVETMSYLDKKRHTGLSGKTYYENLCLKTLNQTIGRGIRHINDYVDIYLVDRRFEGVRNKLSEWMRPRIKVIEDSDDL